MKTVGDLLATKGRQVTVCPPEMAVIDAVRIMNDEGIGALVVCEGGHVVGIVSERDVVRHLCVAGEETLHEPVSAMMTKPVHCVHERDSLEGCMGLVTDRRIRHLPVLEDGQVTGIVSIGDLVKAKLTDQRFVIDQLETYIAGAGV